MPKERLEKGGKLGKKEEEKGGREGEREGGRREGGMEEKERVEKAGGKEEGGEGKTVLSTDFCGNSKQNVCCRISTAFRERVNGENSAEKCS